MCQVRFIGCLHIGHESLAKWRGFKDADEQTDVIIKEWNKVVHKRDLTYILGDITMETDKFYSKLDLLNGRKIAVLGNHDKPKHIKSLLNHVESVGGAIDYKGFLLTHVPIHPMEIGSCRGNIHAHIHHNNKLLEYEAPQLYNDKTNLIKTKDKYYCVDAQLINFKPKTIEELLK